MINSNLMNLKNFLKAQKSIISSNLFRLDPDKEPNSYWFSLEKKLNPHILSLEEESKVMGST